MGHLGSGSFVGHRTGVARVSQLLEWHVLGLQFLFYSCLVVWVLISLQGARRFCILRKWVPMRKLFKN